MLCPPLDLRQQKWLDMYCDRIFDIPVVMTRLVQNAFSPWEHSVYCFFFVTVEVNAFICFSQFPVLAGTVFGNYDIVSYV